MSAQMTMVQAINLALHDAMEADKKVLVLGEDVGDAEGGGILGITKGLSQKFGGSRVRSTPIAEQAIMGAAIGAAIVGYRPVAEIMLMNFTTVAMDMIVNHAAKLRFMSGGQTSVPLVVRTMTGASMGNGGQHSDFLEAWFAHTAGLKVCIPSNPADAYGLMLSCIEDPDPCIFVETMPILFAKGPAPERGESIPLGKARVVREGTSGKPKGVMHTQNSLHALIMQLRQTWLIEPDDRFLVASPLSHIGGSIYAFEMPLLLGTKAILMETWAAETAIDIMTRDKVTHMAGATPFLQQVLVSARAAGTDLPDLKVFVCGGASVSAALIRDAANYFRNAAVTRVYGSTEVPLATIGVTDLADVAHAAETEGRAAIAEVRLAADGEILLRGPQMLVGYVNIDQEREAFDENGFFRSGDQGRLVDADYLVVSGRTKDIVIRNGENIAPKEIEDLLLEHPGVREIAIVGVPDIRTGERACAVIVPATSPAPDLASISAFLETRGIARFKIPEDVLAWESLPKNDAGKVLKQKIRDELLDLQEAAAKLATRAN